MQNGPLSELERKRAEILYAKYKVEWAGIDHITRLRWIMQLGENAPQWRKVFVHVLWLLDRDALAEIKAQQTKIEAEQKARAEAEAKARAEAEAKAQQAKVDAEAKAREEQEKEWTKARESVIYHQRSRYCFRVWIWLFGISTVAGLSLAWTFWGISAIGILLAFALVCVFIPVFVHIAVCAWLAERFTDWNFRAAEPTQAEIECEVITRRERIEKFKRKAARAQ